ncbi:MAG: dihydropteroate synthase [bacterium]
MSSSSDPFPGPSDPRAPGARPPEPIPRILGVLNVSPESHVTESIASTAEEVVARGRMLRENGAALIDLGGRSISPDVPMIGDDEEQARLLPALALLKKDGLRVSIDTWSPATARAALERGADAVNFTGARIDPAMLEAVALRGVPLFLTFMPYGDAYAMRNARPASVGIPAILDHLGPRVEEARRAGVGEVVIDPNLGIIHASTDELTKIHLQLEIVWHLDSLRELGCPILLYAARKPERLARIMMASAVVHAKPDYIRTHTPEMIEQLLHVSRTVSRPAPPTASRQASP